MFPPQSSSGLASSPRDASLPPANSADFDRLVRPLIGDAYRLALVILRDSHEAEDAVQEATVKAWLALGRLRTEASVRTWFLKIVANQCRSTRRTRWFGVLRLGEPPTSGPDPGPVAVQAVDLSRALSRLGSSDRTALFLHFSLDLPLPEVAAVLRVSESAARSRVYRALKRLKPDLEISEVLS